MATSKTNKPPVSWLAVLSLWALLQVVLATMSTTSVFHGLLPGPDEYMRLVRVAALHDGGGWYDGVIARSNAPYGDSLHWTRPLDMLLLGGAAIFSLFMSTKDALFAAGVIISPILDLLGSFAVAWAFRPLLGRDRSILAAFIFLIQPCVLAYTVAGRADHHSLLFVWFALAIGGAIRTIAYRPTTRSAMIAGTAYGLAIWTSVEMTLVVALCQAAAVFSWIRFPHVRPRPQVIAAFAFLAVMLLALVVEHPPGALLTVEFDRLSIPYVVIAALTLAVWAAIYALECRRPAAFTPRRRFVAIGLVGVAAVIVLLALFPGFIGGPYEGIDPRIETIWYAHVAELQPLMPTTLDHARQFLIFIGSAVVALPYAATIGWRNRHDFHGATWLFLAVVLAIYFLMSLQHFRLAPFAEIASTPVLADMVMRLIDWSKHRSGRTRRLLMACAGGGILIVGGILAISGFLSQSATAFNGKPEPACRISDIAPLLNDPDRLGARPLIIAALLDRGPEILYRTRHSVVSAPYHRDGPGIWDSYRIFSTQDEAESRAIITRRGVDLLILCPSAVERRFFGYDGGTGNVYRRLLAGRGPEWLTPVALPVEQNSGFMIYRVRR